MNSQSKTTTKFDFVSQKDLFKNIKVSTENFKQKTHNASLLVLKSAQLETPIGSMIAISNQETLYLLEFLGKDGLELQIEKLETQTKATITPGNTDPILSIRSELDSYFNGSLKNFKTPFYFLGSKFQKLVWDELINIPYGFTKSYKEQAKLVGKPTACRAVANANGANQLAIIIPCHRIINSNGGLGGYGRGIFYKRWLLNHEKTFI